MLHQHKIITPSKTAKRSPTWNSHWARRLGDLRSRFLFLKIFLSEERHVCFFSFTPMFDSFAGLPGISLMSECHACHVLSHPQDLLAAFFLALLWSSDHWTLASHGIFRGMPVAFFSAKTGHSANIAGWLFFLLIFIVCGEMYSDRT